VKDELNDLCRSAGIEWSIQDGHLQFLDLNQPTDALAVKLSQKRSHRVTYGGQQG